MPMQNDMLMMNDRSNSKPEVELQYAAAAVRFFKPGAGYFGGLHAVYVW